MRTTMQLVNLNRDLVVAIREALPVIQERLEKCPRCDGAGRDNDGEGYLDEPCPACKDLHEQFGKLHDVVKDL